MDRLRTGVMIEAELAGRGREWCARRSVGFGVLLERALPKLEHESQLAVEPGPRVLVRVRVSEDLWRAELGRWDAAPGVACDSALRLFLEPKRVPFDLSTGTG